MADALMVQMMRQFQDGLLAEEEAQFNAMAHKWLDVEQALESQLNALALEVDGLRKDGQPVTQEQARKLTRLRSLLVQAQTEIDKYSKYAAELIAERQATLAEAGWQQAWDAMRAGGVDIGRLTPGFDRLPVGAVERMAGLMGDGSPLELYLRGAFGDAATGMMRQLLMGVAQGWNPTRIARAMRDGLGIGLQRALNTARTEQMRVLRESVRAAYETSGQVQQYKRLCAKSVRTCIACLVADGRIYDIASAFEEHNQGRCTLVAWIIGQPEPTWETGLVWFGGLKAAEQEEILGKDYYKAWKGGSFTLEQLVTKHEDPVWGNSLQVTRLGDLVAG